MQVKNAKNFRMIMLYTSDTKIVTLFLDKIVPLVKSEFFFNRQIKEYAFNAN